MNDESGFDWDLLMKFGLGALGLAPRDFWRMTPREFDAAVKGRAGDLGGAAPMRGFELAALEARMEDKAR